VAQTSLPVVQIVKRPGIIELGWGHPDPALLPIEQMKRASSAALNTSDALQYGNSNGPGPLVEWLMRRIADQEGRSIGPDEIVITGGNSIALDQILDLHNRPGDTVLVESPTYHLALLILRGRHLALVEAPCDVNGLRTDLLADILTDLKRAGKSPRALYTIPTFNNPMGVSLAKARRQALVDLAAEHGFLIIEDDVYRELPYDGAAPPSLWSLAEAGVVARMGSFSKSLAPGLRLGYLTAGRDLVSGLVDGGVLVSGGGVNHLTAVAVGELCNCGDFDAHVEVLRASYRERRDTLIAALKDCLPAGCEVSTPGGGYFVWITLSGNLSADDLLPIAEAEGVSYLPGSKFTLNGGHASALRLAFSLYPPDQLAEAARRLGRAIRAAL
jgi:DNA-binding transcriptional MocR family regulator